MGGRREMHAPDPSLSSHHGNRDFAVLLHRGLLVFTPSMPSSQWYPGTTSVRHGLQSATNPDRAQRLTSVDDPSYCGLMCELGTDGPTRAPDGLCIAWMRTSQPRRRHRCRSTRLSPILVGGSAPTKVSRWRASDTPSSSRRTGHRDLACGRSLNDSLDAPCGAQRDASWSAGATAPPRFPHHITRPRVSPAPVPVPSPALPRATSVFMPSCLSNPAISR